MGIITQRDEHLTFGVVFLLGSPFGSRVLVSAICPNTKKSRHCHSFSGRSGATRLGRAHPERNPQEHLPLQFLGCALSLLLLNLGLCVVQPCPADCLPDVRVHHFENVVCLVVVTIVVAIEDADFQLVFVGVEPSVSGSAVLSSWPNCLSEGVPSIASQQTCKTDPQVVPLPFGLKECRPREAQNALRPKWCEQCTSATSRKRTQRGPKAYVPSLGSFSCRRCPSRPRPCPHSPSGREKIAKSSLRTAAGTTRWVSACVSHARLCAAMELRRVTLRGPDEEPFRPHDRTPLRPPHMYHRQETGVSVGSHKEQDKAVSWTPPRARRTIHSKLGFKKNLNFPSRLSSVSMTTRMLRAAGQPCLNQCTQKNVISSILVKGAS